MPLPLIVPIVLLGGGALAIALGAKKKEVAPATPPTPAGATPEQLTWDQTVNKQYQDAMGSTDLDFIGRAVTWMNTYGNRPDLTAAMQAHYQDVYRAKAQQAAYTQATGGPPTSAQLEQTYQTAMSSDMKDPAQLQWASALLRANGRTAQANEVDTKRQSIMIATGQATATAGGVVPTAPPVAVVTPETPAASEPGGIRGATPVLVSTPAPAPAPAAAPAPPAATPPAPVPTPLQTAETQPQADPNGTIGLARDLIGVESQSGWKTALQPNVQVWQSKVSLTADGKFGPKSGLRMADEVGVLPLVRYWSATGGTKDKQLAAYRSSLIAKAQAFEGTAATKPHGVALEQSAVHETGQGYPASPSALPGSDATDFAAKVAAAIQSMATNV
jgi:hypothetical protein